MIKVISSYNISSGIKSQQAKKTFIINSTKTFCSISSSHFWPFNFMSHFNRKTKWKLQKLQKIYKKKAYPLQKKLLKRKENNMTSAKTNAPISQTSLQRLKSTIQTYRMRNPNNLKWSLDNFERKYQKHLYQLVLI